MAVNSSRTSGDRLDPHLDQHRHPSTSSRRDAPSSSISRYDIATVLTDPSSASAFLPSLPSLAQNSYLPTQLTSLGTAFTSSGTLPRPRTPGQKSVAQRRSQAPPLAQTELRKVTKPEFERYLAEIGPDYDTWLRESTTDLDRNDGQRDDRDRDRDSLGGEGHGESEHGSPVKRSSPPERRQRRKHRSAGPDELESLPPLDQVPTIFFDPAFNLSNPRTFDLVTERIQLTPSSSPSLTFSPRLGSASDPTNVGVGVDAELVVPGLGPTTLNELASDQLLHDKLSHFTAVIESHLVREIGLRSSDFFSALSNLQQLHEQGSSTLVKIDQLQAKLGNANEGERERDQRRRGIDATARHGLEVLRLQARRRGLERIEEGVRAVEEVAHALEGVKELVENGEWSDALEVADSIEDAYDTSALPSSSSSSSLQSPLPRPTPSHHPAAPSSAADEAVVASLPSPLSFHEAHAGGAPTTTMTTRLDLTKLSALRSLPLKLSLLRAQVAKSLEGELVSVLEHEMDLEVEAGIHRARRKEAASSSDDGGGQVDEDEDRGRAEQLKGRTRPVVQALVRSAGMESAVQAWRESVLREIRAMVREHLPTGEEGEQDEEDPFATAAVRSVSKQSIDLGTVSDKSLSLAKNLRAMSHEAFLRLARETYHGLLACIEAVDLQSTILRELVAESRDQEKVRKSRRRRPPTESMSTRGPLLAADSGTKAPASTVVGLGSTTLDSSSQATTSAVEYEDSTSSALATEITDVVTAVAELAHVRFSKVLGVRSEVHARTLSLAEFVDVFDLTWQFVLRCEVVVKRMIVGLRGAIVTQSKLWLTSFHHKRINDSAKLVEEEQWSATEVPARVQNIVGWIVEGAMVDPEAFLLGQRRRAAASASDKDQAETDDARSVTASAKQVDIEGRQFFAVSAGLASVETLAEYIQVVLNCPMLTTDAMSKIIEFMKVFNSRSCQVVLGAGAMRSAGLKNITAKNLALASQALSIMVSLIPYIRELIRRHLQPKQAVMLTEFDKLKRDYQEHQNEIHFKLVAIMSDRLIVHSRTLDTLDWEEPSSKEADQPHAYMEALVKEHLTLYKVLSRFLHSETVCAIMSQVFKALDSKLGEEYDAIDFKSEGAKDRVLVDVRYLQRKLGGLKGLEEIGPGKTIESLVLAKTVPPNPNLAPAVHDASPTSLRFPPAASETPSQPTSSLWTSLPASATASALSLALPDAPSTPRTSLDASTPSFSPEISRGRSPSPGPQPPSPVPVPAPLPPSPTPGPVPYKKKSLAERLAERIGRKPAEAVPPQQQQQQQQQSPRTSVDLDRTLPLPDPRNGLEADPVPPIRSEDDKLLDEVQREIPVWTPKGEKELEQIEREVAQEVETEAAEQGIGGTLSSSAAVAQRDHHEMEPGTKPLETDKETEDEGAEEVGVQVAAGDAGPGRAGERDDGSTLEEENSVEPPITLAAPEDERHTETRPSLSADSPIIEADEVRSEGEAAENPGAKVEDESHQVDRTHDSREIASHAEPNRPSTSSENETSSVEEIRNSNAGEVEPPHDSVVAADAVPVLPVAAIPDVAEKPPSSRDAADGSAEPVRPSADLAEPPLPALRIEVSSAPPPISISAAASIPIPPSAPSTPVSSPPPRSPSSYGSAVPELATSPPPSGSSVPPRKKTLKERLAEAARRGSTGSSLVNVASPPPVETKTARLPFDSSRGSPEAGTAQGTTNGDAGSAPVATGAHDEPRSGRIGGESSVATNVTGVMHVESKGGSVDPRKEEEAQDVVAPADGLEDVPL